MSIPILLDRSVKIQPNFMPAKLEGKRAGGESHSQLSERGSPQLMEEQVGISTRPMAREHHSVWVRGDNTR